LSEIRRDPITGRFVIIAPERRLSRAAFARPSPVGAIGGDLCPFCEGQEWAAGQELLAWRTPGTTSGGSGWQVRVVVNREPALRVENQLGDPGDSFFQSFGGIGAHEVVIESPVHSATWATMRGEQLQRVLWAWRERMRDLRRDTRLKSFLVVKNVGAASGATLDHPHSQLVAMPLVPQHLEDKLEGGRAYYTGTGACVFCTVAARELAEGRRLVASDALTVAFTPFASRVPFETWVMLREHRPSFDTLGDELLAAVAERLGDTMRRLDEVLIGPPQTVLLHTAPVVEDRCLFFDWHFEIIPRLLPVPGLAWGGGLHINPVSPEEAATELRRASGAPSASGA
jgi:UDPglucose--hexose-1-phosphate uridylyltransferase